MTDPPQHPLPGLPGLLGITVTTLAPQRVEAVLTVQAANLAPAGHLHAGTAVTLADTACGYGCLASLPAGKAGFTTIELKSNHVAIAKIGQRLHVVAIPVHQGGTTQVWTPPSPPPRPTIRQATGRSPCSAAPRYSSKSDLRQTSAAMTVDEFSDSGGPPPHSVLTRTAAVSGHRPAGTATVQSGARKRGRFAASDRPSERGGRWVRQIVLAATHQTWLRDHAAGNV